MADLKNRFENTKDKVIGKTKEAVGKATGSDEIANALLEEGYEEGRAIAIATSKAKEWNEDHPPSEKGQESSINLHVVPKGDGWVVKEEGADKIRFSADTKAEAVDKSKEWASDTNASVFVHRKNGTVETTHNYS